MFRHSLKAAFRHLWKRRAFGFLNIAGLSIGIACAAFILLWVEDELTFDHNFALRNDIYRIIENERSDQGVNTMMDIPGEAAGALKAEMPGIRNSSRISWRMDELAVIGAKKIKTNGLYADPSFLSMFTVHFVRGDAATALGQPQSVVISETLARACFGDDDPIGKTIDMNAGQAYSVDGLYKVTGVFPDLPANCSFHFQWVSPYTTWENANPWLKGWTNPMAETYVQLDPSASPTVIRQQLTHYLSKKASTKNTLFLWSMNDWHLRDKFENGIPTDSIIRYVRLFSLIAVAILLIACINFMNLSTARSEQRAREVGVLKVVGARRRNLIAKFIGESLLLSFLAVCIAVGLLYLFLPAFDRLVNKQLDIRLFQPVHLFGLLAIAVGAGLVAGSYPAFYLSAFNPIHVLKGLRVNTGGGATAIRKGLVITQFVASVGLIIGTVIIYQQVQHIKDRDLGYTRDNLVYIDLHGSMKDHFEALKDKLLTTGYVENAAVSLHDALHVYSANTGGFSWAGKDPGSVITIHVNAVSPEYVSAMHMGLIGGRDFYSTPERDSNSIIINESLARLMGKEGSVGGILTAGPTNFRVVGIIRDVVYNDVYGASAPLMLYSSLQNPTVMALRFKPNVNLPAALAATSSVITAESPDQPFAYRFADEDFDALFTAETLIGRLSGVFAVLAVLISCMGLFGLAAYTAERRVKEIGIRKVLGASVGGLTGLLLREFIQLVSVSCIIAFPLAFWILHGWLRNYEYRTAIHWWVFGLAGGLALAIAILTVGFQAVRAALANPIRALRSE